MQRSPWASSPTMSLVSRLSWCLAACLTVSGCTQIVDFDRGKIADDTKDGAMPRDSGMDGGGKDSGPKDSGMEDTGVDSGPEEACNPMTHDGCMPNELCCVVDSVNTLGCVPTSLTQCEACGTACDVAVANDCTERTCGCGWMSKVECSGATPKCEDKAGKCVECVNNNDCAGNADGAYCFIPTSMKDDKDNTCVACDRTNNAGCSGTTPICDATATCVACTVNPPNNCGGTLVCLTMGPSAGACQCAADADCTTLTAPICDPTSKICVACTGSGQCATKNAGDVCEIATGACVDCLQNTDCNTTTEYCLNKACTSKKAAGVACDAAAECTSNFCVDGVCCNDACNGTCQACSTATGAAVNGTCGPAVLNTTDAACGALGCNGTGACQKADGDACNGGATGPECNSGFCVDGVCCNSACGDTCRACSTAAGAAANGVCGVAALNAADGACGGRGCNGEGACQKATGDACSGAATGPECDSGFCVDGVCCSSTCGGTCEACTAAKKGSGSDGTCADITAATDPDDECTGAPVCDGDGACVECVGDGQCTTVVGRSFCEAETCVACRNSGDCQTDESPICDGNACVACTASGQCLTKPGADDVCEIPAGTCVDCLQNTDCAGTEYCLNKVCTPKKATGTGCGAAGECTSNFCVDGVCCNDGCTGVCNACSAAAGGTLPDGTCGIVADGTPDTSCPNNCDAAGACVP